MYTVRKYRIFLLVAALLAVTIYYFAGSTVQYLPENLDVLKKVSYDKYFDKDINVEGHLRFPSTPKPDANGLESAPQDASQGKLIPPPPPPKATGENVVVPFIDASLPTKPNLNTDKDGNKLVGQESLAGDGKKSSTPDTKASNKESKGSSNGNSKSPSKPSKVQGEERYPVLPADLIKLPTGEPKPLPKIQFAFKPETAAEKADRTQKQGIVLEAFQHAWKGYKTNAMGCDELKPLSKSCSNQTQFMGWGATLVDTLDTLWITGMRDDFEEALKTVEKIDFKKSTSEKIPVFETTIRYLGGLLSAYGLTDKKYPVLLQKATELADVLMGAFDTPNRLPIPYYYWAGTEDPEYQMSSRHTVLAELGSLSMEFTHLAQLTQKDKYYDAVARITNALDKWQSDTRMPGLWPLRLDSSGCKAKSKDPKPQAKEAASQQEAQLLKEKVEAEKQPVDLYAEGRPQPKQETKPEAKQGLDKRQILDLSGPRSQDKKSEANEESCEPQGLRHEPKPRDGKIVFGIGGLGDSVYEYMPKMHALLGGLNTQYKSMYEYSMKAVRDGLLFRPMIPDEKRSILFAARQEFDVTQKEGAGQKTTIYEATHLTCFAGGMVGLAARMFDSQKDMDVARRLTDGCIWAYESTPVNIMPETFNVMPCDSQSSCPWDEKRWHNYLDLGMQERIDAVKAWNKHTAELYGSAPVKSMDKEDSAEKKTDTKKVESSTDKIEDKKASSTSHSEDTDKSKNKSGQESDEERDDTTSTDGSVLDHLDSFNSNKAKKSDTESAGDTQAAPAVKMVRRSEMDHVDLPDEKAKSESVDKVSKDDAKDQDTKPTKASSHLVEEDKDDKEDKQPASKPLSFKPKVALSHEKYIQALLQENRFPPGYTSIFDRSYKLRPEAIESVFIMWRLTGEQYWREKGWQMFEAIQVATKTAAGNAALADVTSVLEGKRDSMESFWLAETLKYFYLLFSEPDVISLDEYVFNTEAHPFRLPKSS